ncbi:hypothetical protein ANN_09906 [Periplaneta americana]|uniref:Uncharacterized protein n=1 Tax=Periplaneta americana TaxID=6978 RepID=A0ABQ8TMY2_PERAM|nr:hypothetical protein ANN_09906 [Periplaneta americana]
MTILLIICVLADFIKICKRNDPELNACITESVIQLKPALKSGVEGFLPSLEPLFMKEVLITENGGFRIVGNDVKTYGCSNFRIFNMKANMDTLLIEFDLELPHLYSVGTYDVNGRILLIPIKGNGPFTGNWNKVYATPVGDVRDLLERIIEAIESIPEDMLQRAWQEIVHRLDIVTVTAGSHVEVVVSKEGAPLQWSLDVRSALPGRWIGRDGLLNRTPHSPDIRSLDLSSFFFWCNMKDKVYTRDLRDLCFRIVKAIGTISLSMFERTWTEIEYRLDIHSASKAAHMEVSECTAHVALQGKLEDKNGYKFITFETLKIDVTVGDGSIDLQNLFGGEKVIGDAINSAVNSNFKHILRELRHPIEKALEEALIEISNDCVRDYTFDQLLPVS